MQHYDISGDEMPCPQPINEVARVAIVLPKDTTFYSDQIFIPVAFDAVANGVTHEILGASRSGLPFFASCGIFSYLCGDRAMRTVDGMLRISGEAITPECYLALWRKAIAQPLSPVEFTERYGYAAYALLNGRSEHLRGKRKSWSSSPFETFDDFETAYRDQIAYVDDNRRFRIELDLRWQHAARDAFYLESFLSAGDEREQSASSVVLKEADPSHPVAAHSAVQPDLFPPTAEAT